MEEKKESLQVGNFLLEQYRDGEHDYVRVKAVSGIWDIRYRDDNGMFGFVRLLMSEPTLRDYLESFITTLYTIMHCTPDLEFFDEYYKSYNALHERSEAMRGKVSEEEDKKILDNVKLGEELKEALDSVDKE